MSIKSDFKNAIESSPYHQNKDEYEDAFNLLVTLLNQLNSKMGGALKITFEVPSCPGFIIKASLGQNHYTSLFVYISGQSFNAKKTLDLMLFTQGEGKKNFIHRSSFDLKKKPLGSYFKFISVYIKRVHVDFMSWKYAP